MCYLIIHALMKGHSRFDSRFEFDDEEATTEIWSNESPSGQVPHDEEERWDENED